MERSHLKTCGKCYHWFRLSEGSLGECFAHPPRVFKITHVSVNPLTNQPSKEEGLVSHYPIVQISNRACGEFEPDYIQTVGKENRA